MRHIAYLLFLFLLGGCTLARVNVEMVSERTALENQILGTYNSLDTRMLLAASVRGVDETGAVTAPPRQSGTYRDALAAVQTLAFHADDLSAFMRLGWVGENNRGYLSAFELENEEIPAELADFADRYTRGEFEHVVNRVNSARQVLMERVIYLNENLKDSDMPKIERVFADLRAAESPPGTLVQTETGAWQKKESVR